MKKNKSQIFFFILSVIAAGLLLAFLFRYRRAQQEYSAQLEREASSQSSSVISETENTESDVSDVESETVSEDSAAAESSSESESSAEGVSQDGQETPAEEISPSQTEEDAAASDEASIAALATGSPQIRLNTHTAVIPVGGTFSYMSYIDSMTDDKDTSSALARRVELKGTVDTNTAGTYTVLYALRDSDGNLSNQATLTVTVQ